MSFKAQSSGEYQCFACGYMDDDYSYFTIVHTDVYNTDLMCIGCNENYLSECVTIENGNEYQ